MKTLLRSFFGVQTPPQVQEPPQEDASRRAMWDGWEQDRVNAARKFQTLTKPTGRGKYERVDIGDYPAESDEVWVEAHSGDSGIRHDDLTGFVVLSELREFLATTPHIHLFYRDAFRDGCEFPTGSAAIKFARRLK